MVELAVDGGSDDFVPARAAVRMIMTPGGKVFLRMEPNKGVVRVSKTGGE